MAATGRVSTWRSQEGWGVLESDQTPGGCWAHVSVVRSPPGFTGLHPAQEVEFDWEPATQDGYRFRAVAVWPQGYAADCSDSPTTERSETSAYRSSLIIDWDQRPDHLQVERATEPGEQAR